MIDKVITKDKIINGFRATGIMPFNVDNVDFSKCLGKELENETNDLDHMDSEATFYQEHLEIERLCNDENVYNNEYINDQVPYDYENRSDNEIDYTEDDNIPFNLDYESIVSTSYQNQEHDHNSIYNRKCKNYFSLKKTSFIRYKFCFCKKD